jgi:predicted ABC-type exoprotein transport system permease subunit
MSNFVIALLFALGSGAWIYSRLMRTTGNNKKNSLIAAIIAGAVICLILDYILGSLIKKG